MSPATVSNARWKGVGVFLANLPVVALLGYLDRVTGPDLGFSIFFLFPVGLTAWKAGAVPAVVMAVASAVTWHVNDRFAHTDIQPWILYWNASIRLFYFLAVAFFILRLRSNLAAETERSRIDAPTGAANVLGFREQLDLEIRLLRRGGNPFSVAYLDLDGFKGVNDSAGHAMGDALLVRVVEIMKRDTRETDLVARVGGDEFAIILPLTDEVGALISANKVRQGIEAGMSDKSWVVTASIGVATVRDTEASADTILAAADKRLYDAKALGRNRVCGVTLEPKDRKVNPTARDPMLADRTSASDPVPHDPIT